MTASTGGQHPGSVPALSIGLPVYNGERYLRAALDALTTQTFTDFELIISDNASTDRTQEICREYQQRDARVVYVRQPQNVGAVPNHNLLVGLARGKYFKWAAHDDLYAPSLLERCVAELERDPDAVLAHAWDAVIGDDDEVLLEVPYPLDTDNPDPAARLRSLLHTPGGNDFYGVMRTDMLRRVGGHDTYYNADRTFMAKIVLEGRFRQVPEVLYLRRDHPGRATRAGSRRAQAAALDPRRAHRLRHPMAVMYAEYVLGFLSAIQRSSLGPVDRLRCLVEVGRWAGVVVRPGHRGSALEQELDAR
jgi:glycosyltransferase involved in cell wall biosynthesis